MGDQPLWVWGATIGVVLALLVLDFVLAARRPHAVGVREATAWSVFYIVVAVLFGLALWAGEGPGKGGEYFAGWLVEKSLSVDNLFVFVIIMSRFAVPAEFQQKVLLFGIALALVLRAVFIAVGAAAIETFDWTFLVFGGFLIWTAVQLFRHRDEDPEVGEGRLVGWARRRLPVSEGFVGNRILARVDGRRVVTPLFLVLLAVASTDVLFAVDSIPAVYGVTDDPFVVFAANAFALLGLRALYFLIQGLLEKLVYLSLGLSVILGFIGVKLVLHFLHESVSPQVPEVPIVLSLAVILGVLAVTTVASLLRVRAHPEEVAHAGTVRAPRERGVEEAPERQPERERTS
ncbi:MAG: TerC family protein [Motilibacteraceae bacterium]